MSGSQYPDLPAEFFTIPELIAMLGPKLRAKLIQALKDAGVSFIVGKHGWPLVYRDRLLPSTTLREQDISATPDLSFDFSAIHAPSRTTSHRRQ